MDENNMDPKYWDAMSNKYNLLNLNENLRKRIERNINKIERLNKKQNISPEEMSKFLRQAKDEFLYMMKVATKFSSAVVKLYEFATLAYDYKPDKKHS